MAENNKVTELNSEGFDEFVKEGFVLVDFFADWCMPCRMMEPVINNLSEKFDGKIRFAKVNIDGEQELAQKFNVASIPNFVLFKNGEKAHQFMGATSEENFEEKLNSFLE